MIQSINYMMYDLRIMNFGFRNLGITLGTYNPGPDLAYNFSRLIRAHTPYNLNS
jgi:hypothetical protein